jgi:hypothetical protein
MFILVFVVSFGPKKSTLTVYSDIWKINFYQTLSTLVVNQKTANSIVLDLLFRFQFTLFTSRSTIYLLFSFWCFFFFFGESLLLLTFNFNTLSDLVPSSFFLFFKTHVIFFMENGNSLIGQIIMFYILFFTSASFIFLLNLNFNSNQTYFHSTLILDLLILLAVIYLYLPLYKCFLLLLPLFFIHRLTPFVN